MLVRGSVDKHAVFRFDPGERCRFQAQLASHAGQVVFLEVQGEQHWRSLQANRYYWGVVVAAAVEATGQDDESIHAFWKDQFLPSEAKQVEFFHHLTGTRLRHIVHPASTTKQSPKKFRDYVEQCRQWLVDWYATTTPDPDPEYWRTRPPRRRGVVSGT